VVRRKRKLYKLARRRSKHAFSKYVTPEQPDTAEFFRVVHKLAGLGHGESERILGKAYQTGEARRHRLDGEGVRICFGEERISERG
jgi:hypothetical protein